MDHPLISLSLLAAVLSMAWTAPARGEQKAESPDPDPRLEAALPEGFPQPGPLDEVTVKQYPAYRAAWHDEGDGFWSLFRHIKKNHVKMTAPVEMTLKQQLERRGKRMVIASQAFMYERPDQGDTGQQGQVIVRDMPAQTMLSIAVTGKINQKRMVALMAQLDTELADRKEEYEQAGPPRMLGYHSPFVPEKRRWTEFQIPIKKIERKAEQKPAKQ